MGALRGFFVGGFDWNGSTGRGPVVVGLVTLVAIVLVAPRLAEATGWRLSTWQVLGLLSAPVWVQLHGTIVRRLHDAGRSGWWLILAIVVPYMQVLMMLALLALPASGDSDRRPPNLWRRIGFAGTALIALILFSRVFWIDHLVESDHMEPTLFDGDYVAALTLFRAPERGEVVIYAPPGARPVAMRVAGLGGETVAQIDGELVIDGVTATYAPVEGVADVLEETLPESPPHLIRPPEFGLPRELVVAEGSVLLLGDNRPVDAAFATETRLTARVVPEVYVRARIVRVLYSSDAWWSGVPSWIAGMRWGRVWKAVW